jgi:hypothetical protein
MIPFENEYSLFGYGLGRLSIIPLAVAVVFLMPGKLFLVMKHPLFLATAAFVIWGAIVELFHPFSNWQFQLSLAQTGLFAALVGAVSLDRSVFRRTLLSIMLVCTILAFYLVYNYYELVNVDVTGWREGSRLRGAAFQELGLSTGLNVLGYLMGMGAVVALAKLLSSPKGGNRIVWASVFVICALGAFMPLSRGAFIAVLVGSAAVVLRNLGKLVRPGKILVMGGAVFLVFTLMPDALSERLSSLRPGGSVERGRVEGRTQIYSAALDALPSYWSVGVGVGHFWQGRWGREHGFQGVGPHSGVLASLVYFGFPGLILLSLICFVAFRAIPKRTAGSWEADALIGLLAIAFVWLMFTHNLYFKPFGLILGLLIGASCRARLSKPSPRPMKLRAQSFGRRNRRQVGFAQKAQV